MRELTTITQFGARKSIASLHINKLLKSAKENEKINHIFYLVDPNNKILENYLENIKNSNKNIVLYTRKDNNYTDFKRLKKKAPFGGDCNYDFLIRTKEVKNWFLTLHDDTMIESPNLFNELSEVKGSNDFFGYNDTRYEITGYHNIFLDNIPISEQRIGTWFFLGNKNIYLNKNYKIGYYKKRPNIYFHLKYKFNKRLKFNSFNVWLNGGFPFNIDARLDSQKIKVSKGFRSPDETNKKIIAYHLTKITGFIAARNLLKYADTSEEVDQWGKYFHSLDKFSNINQIIHDRKFLLNIAHILKMNDIEDELFNQNTIEELTKKFIKTG